MQQQSWTRVVDFAITVTLKDFQLESKRSVTDAEIA